MISETLDGYTLEESLLNYYSEDQLKANWEKEKKVMGLRVKIF